MACCRWVRMLVLSHLRTEGAAGCPSDRAGVGGGRNTSSHCVWPPPASRVCTSEVGACPAAAGIGEAWGALALLANCCRPGLGKAPP